MELLKGDHAFEVNPVDLIALEVLRVFEPEVYRSIAASRDLLTCTNDRGERSESLKAQVVSLTGLAPVERQPYVQELLSKLFPPIEWAFGGAGYGSEWLDTWYQELRLCHRDLFSRYFSFVIGVDDISQSEIEIVLSSFGDRKRLYSEFCRFERDGRLYILLNRLEYFKKSIPPDCTPQFLSALFDIGDRLPCMSSGLFSSSAHGLAFRIAYWCLKGEPYGDRRGHVLGSAMHQSAGLSIPGLLLSAEESHRDKTNYERLLSDEQLKNLKHVFVEKITDISGHDPKAISQSTSFGSLLYHWRDWSGERPVREWVERLVGTPDGALALVKAFTTESRSYGMSSFAVKTRLHTSIKGLLGFVDLEAIETQVGQLAKGQLRDSDASIVDAFQTALRRHRLGKPDNPFLDRDDEE